MHFFYFGPFFVLIPVVAHTYSRISESSYTRYHHQYQHHHLRRRPRRRLRCRRHDQHHLNYRNLLTPGDRSIKESSKH
jgi:hypothetical protein